MRWSRNLDTERRGTMETTSKQDHHGSGKESGKSSHKATGLHPDRWLGGQRNLQREGRKWGQEPEKPRQVDLEEDGEGESQNREHQLEEQVSGCGRGVPTRRARSSLALGPL